MDYTILIPVIVVQLILFLYCLYIIRNSKVKYLPKVIWGILCLNTLGSIAFLLFGKGERLWNF